jgi:hypothetical protein
MHSMLGSAKSLATIFVAPGGGLDRKRRRRAQTHDHVSVTFRGESYFGHPAPSYRAFDASTLRWAVSNAKQVACWSAPYPEHMDDIGTWMVDAANAGSRFQVMIETVPSRAAEWCEAIGRWKGPTTEVRVFGPECVQ